MVPRMVLLGILVLVDWLSPFAQMAQEVADLSSLIFDLLHKSALWGLILCGHSAGGGGVNEKRHHTSDMLAFSVMEVAFRLDIARFKRDFQAFAPRTMRPLQFILLQIVFKVLLPTAPDTNPKLVPL